ncbi:MAG: anti-sigma factor, partial [Pseudomonadota bacterium]
AQETRLAELMVAAGLEDNDDVELALAAAMNAFAGSEHSVSDVAVPEPLKGKLQADADQFFGVETAHEAVSEIDRARQTRAAKTASSSRPASITRFGQLGWAVAAILTLVVVFALQPESLPDPVDPAGARQALVADVGSSVIEWEPSEIPAYNAVGGDVVWNDELQTGYLRLTGMPANDPAISQYQLWIVDPARDANPVDGGVFDIPSGSDEVIIPIDAKLAVNAPAAFAITREQPGGVVVSDGPLLIVASG